MRRRAALRASLLRVPVARRSPRRGQGRRAAAGASARRSRGSARRRDAPALLGASASEQRPEQLDEALLVEPEAPPVAEEDRGAAFGTLRTPRHWERLLVDAAVIGEAGRWEEPASRGSPRSSRATSRRTTRRTRRRSPKSGDATSPRSRRCDASRCRSSTSSALSRRAPRGASGSTTLGALASRALRAPVACSRCSRELEPMCEVGHVDHQRGPPRARAAALAARRPAAGRRYGKVYVATPDEARGLAFDVVFVPGLAEKIFPQKVVEDPILPDAARGDLADRRRTRSAPEAERLALRLAVGAATRRVVLSLPAPRRRAGAPAHAVVLRARGPPRRRGSAGGFDDLAETAASTAEARIGWPAPVKRAGRDRRGGVRPRAPRASSRSRRTGRRRGRATLARRRNAAPRARAAVPRSAGTPRRWQRVGRPRAASAARGARSNPRAHDRALVLADGAPEFRGVPVSLLPPRGAQARAARRARRDRGHRSLSKGSLVHKAHYRARHAPPRRGLLPVTARAPLEARGDRLDAVLAEVARRDFETPQARDPARLGRRHRRASAPTSRVARRRHGTRRARLDAGALRALVRSRGRRAEQDPRSTDEPVRARHAASACADRSTSSSGGARRRAPRDGLQDGQGAARRRRPSSAAARRSSRCSTRSRSRRSSPAAKVGAAASTTARRAGDLRVGRASRSTTRAREQRGRREARSSDALEQGFLPAAPDERKGSAASGATTGARVRSVRRESAPRKKPPDAAQGPQLRAARPGGPMTTLVDQRSARRDRERPRLDARRRGGGRHRQDDRARRARPRAPPDRQRDARVGKASSP